MMIDTIRAMRRMTSQTLADVLNSTAHTQSEAEIRDQWHKRLKQRSDVTEEGWYAPPPKGIIVAIGGPPNYDRINQPTFRSVKTWPSNFIRINDESFLFAYASQVHIQTGIIGDLSCSLYRGSNDSLRAHIRKVWDTTMAIANDAETGMTFLELYRKAEERIAKSELQNIVYSAHAGSTTDIGHLIPWSQVPPSAVERDVLHGGTSKEIADLVSSKRRFINSTDEFTITNDIAFTIEPRLRAPGLPMVNFHTVVGFENGKRQIITEFDPLFELFNMTDLQS